MSAKPRCYLDFDGVLVDFVRGVQDFHGVQLPYDSIRWGLEDQMGFGDRKADFWAPLGYDFWANLPWTNDGKKILESVLSVFGEEVGFITSPCQTLGCVDGKLAWARRELGRELAKKVFVGGSKSILANPHGLLIDDNDDNVANWREAGGHAILWPRPWNSVRYWEKFYDPGERGLRLDLTRWRETYYHRWDVTAIRASGAEHTPSLQPEQSLEPGRSGDACHDRSRT